MATKKRNKKKAQRKGAGKKAALRKKPAKKAVPKRKPLRKKTERRKKKVRGKSEDIGSVVFFEPKGLGARSAGQSGDLQGLSGIAGAASESVEELLEEGNAFEAELVKGVEDAGDADEAEVKTHEVTEDDGPEEYLGEK